TRADWHPGQRHRARLGPHRAPARALGYRGGAEGASRAPVPEGGDRAVRHGRTLPVSRLRCSTHDHCPDADRRRRRPVSESPVSILSDIACRLGEGPVYDPASRTFFWFDILEKKLLEKPFPVGETRVHALPVMASAMAVVDDKR